MKVCAFWLWCTLAPELPFKPLFSPLHNWLEYSHAPSFKIASELMEFLGESKQTEDTYIAWQLRFGNFHHEIVYYRLKLK